MAIKTITRIFVDNIEITNQLIFCKITTSLNNILTSGIVVIQMNKKLSKILFDVRDILAFEFKDENQKIVSKLFSVTKRHILDEDIKNDIYNAKMQLDIIDSNMLPLTYNNVSFYSAKKSIDKHIETIINKNNIKLAYDNTVTSEIFEYIIPIKPHIETINELNNKNDNFILYPKINGDTINLNTWPGIQNDPVVDEIDIINKKYSIINKNSYDFFLELNNGSYGYKVPNFNINTGKNTFIEHDRFDEIEINSPFIYMKPISRVAFLNKFAISLTVPSNIKYDIGKKIKIINNSESYYDGIYVIIKIIQTLNNMGNWQMELIMSNLTTMFNSKRS